MSANNEEIVPLLQYTYSEFNYDEINHQDSSSNLIHYVQVDYGNNGGFLSTADNSLFFVYLEMRNPPDEIKDHIVTARKYGWKFHVSIDDTNQENIEKGWNLVKDILIREHVYASKLVARGRQLSEPQRGKQITIYTVQHLDRGLDFWSKLASEITHVLAENGVAPSHRPESDEPIEGSNYVSFRSDGYYDDKHYENVEFNRGEDWREQLKEFYPEEFAQFKAGIQIEPPVPNQPANPIWEPPSSLPKCCPF